MNRQQADRLRRIDMLRRYAYMMQAKEIVGWVSDSVTQHIEAANVGLRSANPTYMNPIKDHKK
jgi:hypothetical protein